MDVGRGAHELAHALVQRLELGGSAMDQVAHRAARQGDPERSVALLEPVLRHRARPLRVDEVGDKAGRVPSLLREAQRRSRGLHVPAVEAFHGLSAKRALAQVFPDVLVDDRRLGPNHADVPARALAAAAS